MSIIEITLSLSQTLRARGRARRCQNSLLFSVKWHMASILFLLHLSVYRNDILPFCKMKPLALWKSCSDTFLQEKWVFWASAEKKHCMCSIIWTTNSNEIICIKDWSSEFCNWNQNQSNCYDQSQQEQIATWTSQNWKQLHVPCLHKAREHVLTSRDLFWFYFSLAEKVAYVAWRFCRAGRTSGEIRARSAREREAKPPEK